MCCSCTMRHSSVSPAGKEANWIATVAGRDWFPYFRLYGPERAFFDKTWKLPDIERLK